MKSVRLQKILKLTIIYTILITGYTSCRHSIKSDFSHIEIILDSTSFEKLVANDYISNILAPSTYDTMLASPLVLSYYLQGETDFIHFNPNRGYFASQRGTAYLIFQSRRPGQGKLLEEQWQRVSNDSLVRYDVTGPDFTLTEVVYNHHDYLSKKQHNNLIPMLSSYSVESYRNWGLGDSVEVGMKQFLSKDSANNSKLYKNIISIDLEITQKELNDLTPVLELMGYRKIDKSFFKNAEPTISYVINNNLDITKVKKLSLQLSEDAGNKSFNYGSMSLRIKKNKAEFSF
ncbi:hypothetical protein ATE92_0129 [Ulvibacter sp. MAR_2010_11]|uniref:DUF5829 family protein n=1 Tax=Ulvibacter sp. MAR_2010_11 TaxID=1250229 RepID=UPI000C2BE1AD|nr:DUF5829 family protein [Ulvibacter sp. MAR_2010_11]PKA82005.1 hypothetical protein ATE92_0129 [Ulvibacter sp. MAR_2010_11]